MNEVFKTDVDKIRVAIELRRRGYSIDLETQKDSAYFRGAHAAMLELLRKLKNMKYIEDYIVMKSHKYMSDKEKSKWITRSGNLKEKHTGSL